MQEPLPNLLIEKAIADTGLVEGLSDEPLRQQKSTLIEFPRNSRPLPEWRKQLSQRVREVQERRAREAAEEAAAAREAGMVSCVLPSAQLELVPDLEQPVMNPIVSKALERIERARRPDHPAGEFNGAATAPALEPQVESVAEPEISNPEPAEIKPRLTVVASLPRPEATDQPELEEIELPTLETTMDPEPEATLPPRPFAPDRKPVRLISDSVDDVALSYLETCLALPALAVETTHECAGFGRRVIAGSMDLFLVALMAAPAAAAIEFSDGNWKDPRVIGLMSGITIVTMFAYLTISIALTGRTLGMRMLALRTIDLRTGLIPTGAQSMKRALGYIFALAMLGLGILYALIDPDRRTIYDRFSKTIVIRN